MSSRTEIWKRVPNFERYETSNYGRVRRNKLITPILHNGYYVVNLYKDGNRHQKYVHRLVAEIFLPNKENLPQVNHKDENKLNNRVENLEWCTNIYNSNYGTGKERCIIRRNKNSGITAEKAVIATMNNGEELHFKSASEAERQGFGTRATIIKVCKGIRRTHKGYKWRYA